MLHIRDVVASPDMRTRGSDEDLAENFPDRVGKLVHRCLRCAFIERIATMSLYRTKSRTPNRRFIFPFDLPAEGAASIGAIATRLEADSTGPSSWARYRR